MKLKKLLAMVLALVLVLGLLPATAMADEAPVFSKDLKNYETVHLNEALTLSVTAAPATSYVWETSEDNSAWTVIDGATGSAYVVSTDTDGVRYFRVTAKNGSAQTTSNIATVTVLPLTYSGITFSCDFSEITPEIEINQQFNVSVSMYGTASTYKWGWKLYIDGTSGTGRNGTVSKSSKTETKVSKIQTGTMPNQLMPGSHELYFVADLYEGSTTVLFSFESEHIVFDVVSPNVINATGFNYASYEAMQAMQALLPNNSLLYNDAAKIMTSR